ncbi:MAG: hypothetical protein SF182_07225 [Deltaproteobacteria bacterium]|nr:hypothetical protein [Deltaproteobacteria bacterium]
MTDEELRAFVADARRQVEANLAEIDEVDVAVLPARIRAEVEAARRECVELLASLSDEAIAAEIAAAMYAGRPLTPAEVAAIGKRQ